MLKIELKLKYPAMKSEGLIFRRQRLEEAVLMEFCVCGCNCWGLATLKGVGG